MSTQHSSHKTMLVNPLVLMRHGQQNPEKNTLTSIGRTASFTMAEYIGTMINSQQAITCNDIILYYGTEPSHESTATLVQEAMVYYTEWIVRHRLNRVNADSIIENEDDKVFKTVVGDTEKSPVIVIASQPLLDALSTTLDRMITGQNHEYSPMNKYSQGRMFYSDSGRMEVMDIMPISTLFTVRRVIA